MGALVGTLVGALVGVFVGPLVGTLVDPLVGSNFAVRVLCACLTVRCISSSETWNGSHDLLYVKTLFSEQLSERLSELVGRQKLQANFSERFFSKLGWPPRARVQVIGAENRGDLILRTPLGRRSKVHTFPFLGGS